MLSGVVDVNGLGYRAGPVYMYEYANDYNCTVVIEEYRVVYTDMYGRV